MAAPPPPPPTTGKGANIVSGKVNPYIGTTFYGSDAITPPLLTTSNTITYNGFSWTLSEGVTTGRFISGEPFIVIPAGGVTVQAMSFSDSRGTFSCPYLATGFTSAEGQAAGTGITWWINGFMKNPTPWYEQKEMGFDQGLTYSVYNWNYDERFCSGYTSRNKPFDPIVGAYAPENPFSGFQFLPTKLVPGDVLVTSKSSFNPNWPQALAPQGEPNSRVSWTEPDAIRGGMERYGILTTLSTPPTYADCYRPPVFWNGASLTNRPIFYRHDMVNRPDDHLISLSGKSILGKNIVPNSIQIQTEIEKWNNFVNERWGSSYIPYWSNLQYETVAGKHDLYNNNDTNEIKYTYGGYTSKIIDQIAQAAFAGWVTKENRKKALDKVTQFCIDSWGLINGGGIVIGNGGHTQSKNRPWNILLGWLYNRNDIKNYITNQQFLDRIAPGLTGSLALNNVSKYIPIEHFYKSLVSQEYLQRTKLFGCDVADLQGFTLGKGTNSSIPLYHGLTSPSLALTGATGASWLYKMSGISAAYGYTITSFEKNGQVVTGSFATIVADRNFVARIQGLGPRSGAPLPAILPPLVDSNGKLINRCFTSINDVEYFWGFDGGYFINLYLKIVSGAGAGPTVYRIVRANNTRISPSDVPRDGINNLRYASFILDRDFQNGVIDNTSVFDIFPFQPSDSTYSFTADSFIGEIGLGATLMTRLLAPNTNSRQYLHQSDEPIMKHAALHNWLGITQDQFLIDYTKHTHLTKYLNGYQNDYVRVERANGSAYLGEILSENNLLGGLMISTGLGLTGDQFYPEFIAGLSGQSDNDPAFTLDGITLEFIPQQINSYEVVGGSGVIYTGYGAIFDQPQTLLGIKAIIDDKLFIDIANRGLYQLLPSLKMKFGPFLTNSFVISDDNTLQDENEYIDQIAFIDFGAARSSSDFGTVTTSTKYVKELPSFQEAAANSTLIKASFITDQYGMAGAAGILPNFGETNRLVSTHGMASLKRTNSFNQNEVKLTLPPQIYIENNDLWYCISSPTIGSGNTDMAEEYKYSNWVKVSDPTISTNEITFTIPNLHNGSLTPDYNPSTTDDKLIFFRYLAIKNPTNADENYPYLYRDVNIPSPIGLTALPFNSTNYSGWNNNDIVKLYKISQIKSINSTNSDGYMIYTLANVNSSTDYRGLAYNHFRLWHNNFYEYENISGFNSFTTFIQNDLGQNEPYIYHTDRYRYDDFFTLNSIKYYSPKNVEIYTKITESDVQSNERFYDKYIHGQTMVFHMPLVPQTLLWASGVTT